MIAAGGLDRRVQIDRYTIVQTGTGEETKNWAQLTIVWGSKTDISDREKIAMQEVSAEITTRFVVRWSTLVADVNPKDRVVCEGRTYDIWGVKEIGRRDGLEITAAARIDG